MEINRECRAAYKTVLEHISKEDCVHADTALSDIDDKCLYQRDSDQIKYNFQNPLNKLMSETTEH